MPECLTWSSSILCCIVVSTVISYRLYPTFKAAYHTERVNPNNKAVFISGCDSGFGHEFAKRLDSRGFVVFAGCQFPDGKGAKNLKESSSTRLHVVGIDVGKNESVLDAVKYVKKNLGNTELLAVVNNAGVLRGFDLVNTTLENFEVSLNVNTLGPVRITKAFLPLLIKSKGRVVVVTSLATRMIIPHTMAYTMSKFGARAFCETLRQEMHQWGVKVIEIEPEGFRTGMANREAILASLEEAIKEVEDDIRSIYGDEYFQEYKNFITTCNDIFSLRIYKVVNDLEDAVSLLEPCNVYTPARNTTVNALLTVLKSLPTSVTDKIIRFLERTQNFPIIKQAKN